MPDELTRLVLFLIILAGAATLAAFGLHGIADHTSHPQPVSNCNIADDDCVNYCKASCMATPPPCLDTCIASCD
jgi:hypothetical protein